MYNSRMRLLYKLLLVFVVIVASFVGFWKYDGQQRLVDDAQDSLMHEYRGYGVRSVVVAGKEYRVFIADTPELRTHGLSGKTDLPKDYGMEFVFEDSGVYGFWMKDMRFSIDIIWVRDGVVVDIWEDAQTPVGAHIPSYSPKGDADRVYEFKAGFVKEYGLKVGDKIF